MSGGLTIDYADQLGQRTESRALSVFRISQYVKNLGHQKVVAQKCTKLSS